MRKALVLSVLIFVSAGRLRAQEFAPKVDSYMKAQVEVNHFSGSILIAQHGKIIVKQRYGLRNGFSKPETEEESRYRVGSIAKQFIAAGILLLQEKGKLQLQDSVCKYIAKCPDGWKEIKIFNLLVQTDGIPELDLSIDPTTAKSLITTSTLLSYLADQPLEFKPGEKFKYGNSGYAILGTVIEKVSGEPYRKYLKDHIFVPLGMRETSYDDPNKITPAHLGLSRSITPSDLHMTARYGWGALYSTVEDLYLWERALTAEELLSQSSTNAIFTPYIDGYGFGWVVLKEFDRTLDTSAGGIYLFGSAIRRYAADDACVIVLSDSKQADAGRISRDLAAILFNKHYESPVEHHAVDLNPDIYDAYAGRYELGSGLVVEVRREANRLMIQSTSAAKIELYPESETRFFAKDIDAVINFVKSTEGKATQLVLQQGGREISGLRIN
jgi:CubicO group peptidase (beta-lactamase class C family)